MVKEKIFVPLTDDLLFKEVMTHPDNRESLIDFLMAVTGIEESVIRCNLVVEYESILNKTRKKIAKGKELLVKMDEFAEMYVNDEKTKEIYGKWGEYIALEKEKNLEKKKALRKE